ncbi:MAG: adenylyltransferase/cytidyltransferase family protein [Actinomycetota bacterium]|nr:adenylyltransferase/cytidyltransferase family protein [Actinomycetota bacterium]
MHPSGLIIGRFDPPHLGHSYMIEWARERCEQLVVFVNTKQGEAAPGDLRAQWLQDLHPEVKVVQVEHDLHNDWDDQELWAQWINLLRSKWPLANGPEVVVSSDFYISELAQRLGAEALVCDPERTNVPISATLIRNDPATHLERLAPSVRDWVERNWLTS